MASYLIGLDHGTGGAKACIIDEAANILAYAYREYPIYAHRPGWSEHDPHLYWKTACEVIKECLAISGIRPDQIKGIANSSALPSLVMVDKYHDPINLAYNQIGLRASSSRSVLPSPASVRIRLKELRTPRHYRLWSWWTSTMTRSILLTTRSDCVRVHQGVSCHLRHPSGSD